MTIEFQISLDDLRIDPARKLELQSIYAGAALGDLAINQQGAWISDRLCIFYYSELPPGFVGPLHLRQEMFEKLKEICKPIAGLIQ